MVTQEHSPEYDTSLSVLKVSIEVLVTEAGGVIYELNTDGDDNLKDDKNILMFATDACDNISGEVYHKLHSHVEEEPEVKTEGEA